MDLKIFAFASLMLAGALIATGASAFPWNGVAGTQNEDMANALKSGDYEGFKTAVAENVNGRMTEEKFNRMAERFQNMEAARTALESGDYSAWKAAVEAAKPPWITDVVTEANFGRFAEMHAAMQSGDLDTAKAIAEELGLNDHGMMGGFRGHTRGGFKGNCPMAGDMLQ